MSATKTNMSYDEAMAEYNRTHCEACYRALPGEDLHPTNTDGMVCTACRRGDYGYELNDATGLWEVR
jgi:hypothetical protein